MEKDNTEELSKSRTHFIDKPKRKRGPDRRKHHCFVENDRRSGIAYGRREAQRKKDKKSGDKNKEVYNPYFKIE